MIDRQKPIKQLSTVYGVDSYWIKCQKFGNTSFHETLPLKNSEISGLISRRFSIICTHDNLTSNYTLSISLDEC